MTIGLSVLKFTSIFFWEDFNRVPLGIDLQHLMPISLESAISRPKRRYVEAEDITNQFQFPCRRFSGDSSLGRRMASH